MTHRFISSGTPLSHFSANGAAKGYELLIRVVQVNDDGKLTLPARELWAKIDAESDKLEFLLNSVNSVDDDQEDQLDTTAEANEAMSGPPWLRSLKRLHLRALGRGTSLRWSRLSLASGRKSMTSTGSTKRACVPGWQPAKRARRSWTTRKTGRACRATETTTRRRTRMTRRTGGDIMGTVRMDCMMRRASLERTRSFLDLTKTIRLWREVTTRSRLRSLLRKVGLQLEPMMTILRSRPTRLRSWVKTVTTKTRKMAAYA